MKVRVGIVGAGAMGALHARTVARSAEAELAWVHDCHPERAWNLAKRYDARVGEHPADLVIVATPARAQAEVVGRWRDRAWLLVEKPFGADVDEALRMEGPRIAVGYCERFAYPNGRGRIRGGGVARAWRVAPYRGRGGDQDVIGDLLVHDLDLLTWWIDGMPEIRQVRRYGVPPNDGVEVALAFEDGSATLHASRAAGRPRRGWEVGSRLLERSTDDPLSRQLRFVIENMYGSDNAIATALDAIRTQRLAERIRRWAASGRSDAVSVSIRPVARLSRAGSMLYNEDP